ncbi:PREDICTED: PHD and RING finger domain-containing protein 1-like [Condylura cristata]|uniref:PHD and RING finger domain-containing protein 1-like n=1 Tax=Condylura cristata TaxID=143302 RepID=UPI00064384BB|nr:PREDICTED: PHD and RING finger domain-containing protein 1-like [Condylura cristata]
MPGRVAEVSPAQKAGVAAGGRPGPGAETLPLSPRFSLGLGEAPQALSSLRGPQEAQSAWNQPALLHIQKAVPGPLHPSPGSLDTGYLARAEPSAVLTPTRRLPDRAGSRRGRGVALPRDRSAAVTRTYMKKLHVQERAVEEVKLAIKPFYQRREVTKDEYKDILRKAVQKICHSKSGEINPVKVGNLVRAYVDKYRHMRRHRRAEAGEGPGAEG